MTQKFGPGQENVETVLLRHCSQDAHRRPVVIHCTCPHSISWLHLYGRLWALGEMKGDQEQFRPGRGDPAFHLPKQVRAKAERLWGPIKGDICE